MAASNIDSLGSLIGIVSSLKKMTEPRGMDKNTPGSIIKQEDKETVEPSLDSNEISRLEKVATILGRTFIKLGVFKQEEIFEPNAVEPAEPSQTEKPKPVVNAVQALPAIVKQEVKTLPERVLPTIVKPVTKTFTESPILKEKKVSNLIPNIKAIDIKPIIKQEQKIAIIDSNLKVPEVSRYEKIADIFGRVIGIGKYTKGPEAARLGDLTPDKPSPLKVLEKGIIKTSTVKPEADGLLPSLLGLGSIWQLFKGKIKLWLFDKLKDILTWTSTKLWGIAKSIVKKLQSITTWIGAKLLGITKSLAAAVKNKLVKPATKAILKTAAKVAPAAKAILKPATKVAPAAKAILKPATKVAPAAKAVVSEAAKVAPTAKAVVSEAAKVAPTAKAVVSEATKTVVSEATKVAPAAKAVVKVAPAAKAVVSEATKVAPAAKSIFSRTIDFTSKKLSKGTSQVTQTASNVKGSIVSGTAKLSAEGAKSIVRTAAGRVISSSGGIMNFLGKWFAKGAKKVPVVGPVIESVLTGMDIKVLKQQLAEGIITQDELQQQAGKRVIEGVGSTIGISSGAVLAGTIGSVVPVAGTALGAIVGGVLGDQAGRFLADIITDYIIPPKYTKAIGAFVTGTSPPKEELQDYIMQNGTITPFSTKDQVLGMKTGGAIDNLLSDFSKKSTNTGSIIKNIFNSVSDNSLQALSVSTAKYNDFAKSALTKQINQQEQVIDLLIQLIKKPSGSNTTVQHMSQPNSTFASSNFRDTFKQQTLVV